MKKYSVIGRGTRAPILAVIGLAAVAAVALLLRGLLDRPSDFDASEAAPSHEAHPPAPDFELTTLDGASFHLASQRGKVVVINFWATWCAPCRVEIPGFLALQRELEATGLRFIGVSLDDEGFEVVRPFATEMGISYPLVIGDEELAASYGGIEALPTTFVLDRRGRIRQRFIGMVDDEVLRPVLDDLLRED